MRIGIGYLPTGIKPCLYYYKAPNQIIKLATFISRKQAKEFIEVLKKGITKVSIDARLEGEE